VTTIAQTKVDTDNKRLGLNFHSIFLLRSSLIPVNAVNIAASTKPE